MATEKMNVYEVLRETTLLQPGASLSIPFFPSNGRAEFTAYTIIKFTESYLGAPVLDTVFDGGFVVEPPVNPTPGPVNPAIINRVNDTLNPANNNEINGPVVSTGSAATYELFLAPLPIDLRPGMDGVIRPPVPPLNPEKVRIEVFRESSINPVADEKLEGGAPLFMMINDIQPVGTGISPERWVARFTNISLIPLNLRARLFYNKLRTVEITPLPLNFFNKLIHQAIRDESLGLKFKMKGDTITLDFSQEIKNNFGFEALSTKLPFDLFPDDGINLIAPEIQITLDNKSRPGRTGQFPHANINFSFETLGNEIEFLKFSVNLSRLYFEFDIFFDNYAHMPGPVSGLGFIEDIRGNFSRIPYLTAEITAKTDIEFSDRAVEPVRGAINAMIKVMASILRTSSLNQADIEDRLESLNKYVTDLLNDAAKKFAPSLASYLQIGIQFITDKNSEFHGLRSNTEGWDVLSRPFENPIIEEVQIPETINFGAPDPGPIDSPQPDSELDQLNQIDHIVVLMMENRSYDHVLGYHSHPNHGRDPRYNGLTGNERNTISNIAPDARPHEMPGTKFFPGPPHGHSSVLRQIADGAMSGFGNEFLASIKGNGHQTDPRSIMNFHVADQLKHYDQIVLQYGVATNWFSAFPGGTFPNRFCAIAGGTPILDNDEIIPDGIGYIDVKTIFDFLEEENKTWRYYEQDLSFLRLMDKYRLDTTNIRDFGEFENDARKGLLPMVTYIDPNFTDNPLGTANDDHPGGVHTDMVSGQNLVGRIINALRDGPAWANTMFIITYDEHGGFYDHVPPPGTPPSPFNNVAKVHPDCPNILGVRVPAFIVSPRTPKGLILNRVFDHTSIVKTIVSRFIPSRLDDMPARVKQASHLGGAVPLKYPRIIPDTFLKLIEDAPGIERLEKGSFHDKIATMASPVKLSEALINRLKPKRDEN